MHLGRNTCYLMLLVAVLAAGGRTEQNAERCHEGAMSEKEEHSEELGCRGRSQRDHNRFLAHRDSTMESENVCHDTIANRAHNGFSGSDRNTTPPRVYDGIRNGAD
ncbi:uncharacterized protein LOC142574155 isoform X2 [Dermacentor variabilis]|uniref:uncharacterized protein LOC142574155 isoform X2 n=1 Tax=Dermacentor variabilis TaxID=34621 RepID=UPI003F5C8384